MCRADFPNGVSLQCVQRRLQSLRRRAYQVHSTEHCIHRGSVRQFRDVIQCVDYTGMGTAQNYDEPGGGFDVQGLVVDQGSGSVQGESR